mmetsp:Transcript_30716/g.40801  ORF Transcript_30716/g.40801 Transcript_30716/m.40801 type:complete len:168 (+) Transcript_30716:97-600(+)
MLGRLAASRAATALSVTRSTNTIHPCFSPSSSSSPLLSNVLLQPWNKPTFSLLQSCNYSSVVQSSSSASWCNSFFASPLLRNVAQPKNNNNVWMMMMNMREKSTLKTNKSAAKRLFVRGGGGIKRQRSGKSHNTGYKGRSRVNRLASSTGIKAKGIEKRMRRLIGAS